MTKKFSFLKRFIAAALVLILATGTNMVAFAAADNTQVTHTINGEGVNPHFMYSGAGEVVEGNINGSYSAGVRYGTNAEEAAFREAAVTIRNGMVARAATIPIRLVTYRTDFNSLISEIFQLAISEELANTPDAGDYLAWQYGGYNYSGSSLVTDDGIEYNINLNVTYYTTANEEAQVANRINNALNDMHIEGLSDYEKIKNIYDYVCRVCNYDYTTNDNNLKKFSAYGAVVNGKAVCQGYSSLLHRMLKTAGVDTRVITSSNHSWNIVKLGDYYYNLDATWDDSNYDEGLAYTYFLKCNVHFDDHIRQPEYNTNAFNARYPMAAECYTDYPGAIKCMKECTQHEYVLTRTIPATTTSVGYNFFTCTKCGRQYNSEIQPIVQATVNNPAPVVAKTTASQTVVVQSANAVVVAPKVTVNKATLKTVTAKSKGFVLKWGKVANVTGYEIEYSTSNKFTHGTTKTVVVNKNATTSKTITKLKGNKKYFIRIRAYKLVNGTKCYSSWGTVKNVKTKK